MQLLITTERADDALAVRTSGEVDLNTVDDLDSALAAACSEARPPMVVVADLEKVTFMASSGLSVLVRTHQRCQQQGTPLRVVVGNAGVRRGLQVTGLDQVLDVRAPGEEN
ncbi:STAS domain-containing protein [Prauserella cavernicola]|uniref:Anti-sigma factor antagonist n=1 Tax=Prauserella cavernicola TaxID=2800127 RepID=A0A934QP24_9PSEU|nr:STAS domain-containing protein [Prauserella cavernicola]MBK1783124.1 STAS domain-containing protein [Prauserella cavernicola]